METWQVFLSVCTLGSELLPHLASHWLTVGQSERSECDADLGRHPIHIWIVSRYEVGMNLIWLYPILCWNNVPVQVNPKVHAASLVSSHAFPSKSYLISQRVDETSTALWSRNGDIMCSNTDNDRSFISAFTLQSRDIYTASCEEKNPFGQEITSPRLHIVSWLERLWQIKKKKKKTNSKGSISSVLLFIPPRRCASSQRLTVVQKRAPQVSYSQIRLVFVIQISHSNRVLEFLFKRFITCLI